MRNTALNSIINNANNKKQIEDKEKVNKVKEKKEKIPQHIVKNTGSSVAYWNTVLDKIKQNGKIMIYTNLIGTKATKLDDMTIGIEFPNKLTDFANKVLNEYENKAFIEKLVSIEEGITMRVKYLDNGSNNDIKSHKKIDDFVSQLDIPINIIDE